MIQKPAALSVTALSGEEDFFTSDKYLIPVIEDDPLLRKSSGSTTTPWKFILIHNSELQSDDWSDDEDDEGATGTKTTAAPADLGQAMHRIRQLEEKLRRTRQEFTDYRGFVKESLNLDGLAESLRDSLAVSSTNAALPLRDDDSHYFQSYAENGNYPPANLSHSYFLTLVGSHIYQISTR